MSDTEHCATCACGQLRVTTLGAPEFTVACNCLACHRRSGSPFGVGAYDRRDKVVSIDGETRVFERTAETGRKVSNRFCPRCGTAVNWELEMQSDHVGIAAGCFADPGFITPARAIWMDQRHHRFEFPEDMPKHATATL